MEENLMSPNLIKGHIAECGVMKKFGKSKLFLNVQWPNINTDFKRISQEL